MVGNISQESWIDAPEKTQAIRLLDVFLIGPLMLWGGLRLRGVGGYTLAAFGVATVLYNGRNFLRHR